MKNNRIKSRLLSYIVGLGMTVSLSGCGGFSYNTDSNGDIVVEGTMTYEIVSENLKLIEVEILDKNKLYIVEEGIEGRPINKTYVDIFTNKKICDEDSSNIISVHNLHDYLLAYEEVKEKYSFEDMDRLYNKIKEDYYSAEKDKVKMLK